MGLLDHLIDTGRDPVPRMCIAPQAPGASLPGNWNVSDLLQSPLLDSVLNHDCKGALAVLAEKLGEDPRSS